jgi:CcmD family protein
MRYSMKRATVLILILLVITPVLAHAFAAGSTGFGVAGQQPQPEPPKQTDEFVPISQLPPQDQLPAAPLLVTAYSFVWLALFGYLVSVAQRLSKVQREVERLESDMKRSTRA